MEPHLLYGDIARHKELLGVMNDVFDRDLGLAFPIGGEPLCLPNQESMHKHCDSSDAAKKPNQTGLGGNDQPDCALSVSIGHFSYSF
jgi:hypothetical protein